MAAASFLTNAPSSVSGRTRNVRRCGWYMGPPLGVICWLLPVQHSHFEVARRSPRFTPGGWFCLFRFCFQSTSKGWVATGVFAGSYLCREPQTLRKVQAFAAVLWIGYGGVIYSFPIIICDPRELVRLAGRAFECIRLSTVSERREFFWAGT